MTAAAVPGLARLELDADGRALVPATAPEVRFDREVRRLFDVRDPIAVVIRSSRPEGIFHPATLRRVAELTAAVREIDGVRPQDVASLATEPGFRHRPGTLTFGNLLEPVPETAEAIAELREDLRRIELYDGTLVSRDGTAAAVLVGAPPQADRAALVGEIRRLAAATASTPESPETVEILGAPVAEALLGRHILADLGVPASWLGEAGGGRRPGLSRPGLSRPGLSRPGMVPIAVAVMGLVFLAAFRRPAAALLPLFEIGVCLAIVFGTMGWLGVPVYLTTAVLPVILTAVGAADEIHVFRRYLDLGGGPGGHRERVRRTLEEMAPPVVRTSVTTAVAFLSFAVSPLGPVRSFGLFTAFGVLVCMVFSLTVVPALLVLVGPKPWGERRRPLGSDPLRPALPPPAAVLIAAAFLAVAALDGVRRLRVQDSWIDGFAPGSAFARATRSFDEQFLGSHLLRLVVEVDAPRLAGEVAAEALGARQLEIEAPAGVVPARLRGSWLRVFQLGGEAREWTTWVDDVQIQDGAGGASRLTLTMPKLGGSPRFWLRPEPGERLGYEVHSEPLAVPEVLERIADLERHVGGLPGVGGVLGPARYLATVGFMLRPGDDGSRRLPDDPRDAKNRWQNYGRVRGEERLRQLVDDDRRRALVTVFLEGSNYADTERLMDEIRAFEAARLEPHGIRLGFAGDVAVSQATIDAVVTTQVRSLLLSLAGIVAVTAVAGRSLRRGLLSVVPPAFAVLLGFAAMGWLGVPLGVATSTFAAMTLGVGVDFAIHLLARFEMARRGGLPDARAIAAALAVTGPAIVIDAVAVGLGFATLMLSEVPANVRLGGLLTTAVLGCLAATLLLVPALLARFPGPPASPPRPART